MQVPEKSTLIEFPTHFPIKVMGARHDDFVAEVMRIIMEKAPKSREQTPLSKLSAKGNYESCTVEAYVESQEELDHVYRALTSSSWVKVVL